LVTLSVAGNLGFLGVFKYHGFFVGSAIEALATLGLEAHAPTLEIVLPVGISFYTFQTMSYTLDIFRKKIEPTRSLLDFANFVAFFPQLVAGPIERASRLLPQLASIGDKGRRGNGSGWGLIAIGAFKKVVIADNLAPLVDATYADPSATYAPALWIGTYAFAIQIYCDFSGYSDIAVGLGRLMGIDIMQNFRSPYASTGPREFWRRWHISLSTWLRDYLYISLGGNRRGPSRTRINLMVTMLLGGLWHGAAWNFVLWGAYHGLLLVLGRARGMARLGARIPAALQRLIFFHLLCVGWALFRSASLSDARIIVRKLLDPTGWRVGEWLDGVALSEFGGQLWLYAGLMFAVVVAQNLAKTGSDRLVETVWRWPWSVRLWLVVWTLYACIVFAPEERPPFIYFQF
jgi:D-alanyl-lipoteichoic acid acyltransferase DltB (MBOAT superfamily)